MCGKLLTYLRERRSRPDRFSGSGALTSRDLTVFAYCVARGMDYIASKGVSCLYHKFSIIFDYTHPSQLLQTYYFTLLTYYKIKPKTSLPHLIYDIF